MKKELDGAPQSTYTWNDYAFQSPLIIDYLARLNGVRRKNIAEPFTYCDLGCGNAMSILTFAAAMPHAEFYGVDINPQHIQNANSLAKAGGLKNIHLIESSFKDLLQQKLPQFDYIAMHGVVSWINTTAYAELLEVIKKFIKPGGVVYISYNAMPGSSDTEPLQYLLKMLHDQSSAENEVERLREAVKVVDTLTQLGAGYLKHPNVVNRVDELFKKDSAYLIHEYVVDEWHTFYFNDICRDMATCGLKYLGQSNLMANNDLLHIPRNFLPILQQQSANREQLLDYIVDRNFRADVYIAAETEIVTNQENREKLIADVKVSVSSNVDWINGKVECPRPQGMPPEFASTIIELAYNEAITIADMLSSEKLKLYKQQDLLKVIKYLISTEQLTLAFDAMREVGATDFSGRIKISKYNFAVLEFCINHKLTLSLSGSVTIRGAKLQLFDMVMLYAVCAYDPDDIVKRTIELFKKLNIVIHSAEKEPLNDDELQKFIELHLSRFREFMLPKLYALKVIL